MSQNEASLCTATYRIDIYKIQRLRTLGQLPPYIPPKPPAIPQELLGARSKSNNVTARTENTPNTSSAPVMNFAQNIRLQRVEPAANSPVSISLTQSSFSNINTVANAQLHQSSSVNQNQQLLQQPVNTYQIRPQPNVTFGSTNLSGQPITRMPSFLANPMPSRPQIDQTQNPQNMLQQFMQTQLPVTGNFAPNSQALLGNFHDNAATNHNQSNSPSMQQNNSYTQAVQAPIFLPNQNPNSFQDAFTNQTQTQPIVNQSTNPNFSMQQNLINTLPSHYQFQSSVSNPEHIATQTTYNNINPANIRNIRPQLIRHQGNQQTMVPSVFANKRICVTTQGHLQYQAQSISQPQPHPQLRNHLQSQRQNRPQRQIQQQRQNQSQRQNQTHCQLQTQHQTQNQPLFQPLNQPLFQPSNQTLYQSPNQPLYQQSEQNFIQPETPNQTQTQNQAQPQNQAQAQPQPQLQPQPQTQPRAQSQPQSQTQPITQSQSQNHNHSELRFQLRNQRLFQIQPNQVQLQMRAQLLAKNVRPQERFGTNLNQQRPEQQIQTGQEPSQQLGQQVMPQPTRLANRQQNQSAPQGLTLESLLENNDGDIPKVVDGNFVWIDESNPKKIKVPSTYFDHNTLTRNKSRRILSTSDNISATTITTNNSCTQINPSNAQAISSHESENVINTRLDVVQRGFQEGSSVSSTSNNLLSKSNVDTQTDIRPGTSNKLVQVTSLTTKNNTCQTDECLIVSTKKKTMVDRGTSPIRYGWYPNDPTKRRTKTIRKRNL